MLKEKIIKACGLIIEYGLLAIVFFVPLIFDFSGSIFNIIDTYKAVFFRTVLVLVLLAYLAKIFISGQLSYRGSKKIFLLVIFLALSFFLSSLFSIRPSQSWWGDFFRQQGFYNFFNYLLFFVLLILNFSQFKRVQRLIMAAVGAATLTSIYGLVQYLNLDPVSWSENAIYLGRIFSNLGQPNWFGHWLVLVLPLSLYAFIFMVKGFWLKFFTALAIITELLSLILTYSRAAWLGFLGSMVLLLVIWLLYKRREKIAWGLVLLIFLSLASVVGLNFISPVSNGPIYDINLINRLKSTLDFSGGSNKMRFYYLKSSLAEIKQASPLRLFFGYGPETLTSIFIQYYQPDWGVYEAINGAPDRAHNWLFDELLALGFFGLIINLAFLAYLVLLAMSHLALRQNWSAKDWLIVFLLASLAAYSINNLFSFSLLTVFIYLYLILALVWLVTNGEQPEKIYALPLTSWSRGLIWVFTLATALIFFYTNNLNQIRAELYFVKAVKALELPACGQAINQLERVLSLWPNNSYYQENFLFFSANCLPIVDNQAAKIELSQETLKQIEVIKDRDFSSLELNLARFYARLGANLDRSYYQQSEEIFNELILKYPLLTPAYEDLGRLKLEQGDYLSAIKLFDQALNNLPLLDHPALNQPHRQKIVDIEVRLYENLAKAYLNLKDYNQAAINYQQVIRLDPYRATSYKGLADIYYLKGQLDQAIKLNQRGFMLSPNDYHWPLALSLLYRETKDLAQAKRYLAQALKLAPEKVELKQYEKELNK